MERSRSLAMMSLQSDMHLPKGNKDAEGVAVAAPCVKENDGQSAPKINPNEAYTHHTNPPVVYEHIRRHSTHMSHTHIIIHHSLTVSYGRHLQHVSFVTHTTSYNIILNIHHILIIRLCIICHHYATYIIIYLTCMRSYIHTASFKSYVCHITSYMSLILWSQR